MLERSRICGRLPGALARALACVPLGLAGCATSDGEPAAAVRGEARGEGRREKPAVESASDRGGSERPPRAGGNGHPARPVATGAVGEGVGVPRRGARRARGAKDYAALHPPVAERERARPARSRATGLPGREPEKESAMNRILLLACTLAALGRGPGATLQVGRQGRARHLLRPALARPAIEAAEREPGRRRRRRSAPPSRSTRSGKRPASRTRKRRRSPRRPRRRRRSTRRTATAPRPTWPP